MAVSHRLEQYGVWRNRQLLFRDALGWLPSLVPCTLAYCLPPSNKGHPTASALEAAAAAATAAAYQRGSYMHCACAGESAATGGWFYGWAAWPRAPLCHALLHDHDILFMLLVWPLLLVMLLHRNLYLARRTQLVAAARLGALCTPAVLFLLLPRDLRYQHLKQRGVWVDNPGAGLAAMAAGLGLQELLLKQLLSLLATSWMEHILMLPPAWEAAVSALQALACVVLLATISQAVGQLSWPWTAALATANWVLCHLLPVYSAARQERCFQAQYQKFLAATTADQEAMAAVAGSISTSSSITGAPIKSVSPPPSPRGGIGNSRQVAAATPGAIKVPPAGQPSAAVAEGSRAAWLGQQGPVTPSDLPLSPSKEGSHLYSHLAGGLGGERVGACACISFTAAAHTGSTEASTGDSQHSRLVAIMQEARSAMETAAGAPAAVLSTPAAAGPQGTRQGPSTGLLAYIVPSTTGQPIQSASSSSSSSRQLEHMPSKDTCSLLVRVQAHAAGQDQVWLALWAWQRRGSSCAAHGTGRLWWEAVEQRLLHMAELGVTHVTAPHIWTDGMATTASCMDTGVFPEAQQEAIPGVVLARGSQGAVVSRVATPPGAGGAAAGGGMSSNTTSSMRAAQQLDSKQRPPVGGRGPPGCTAAGGAMQWAFQLHWHAPFCLSDQGREAAEAPELLLQLSLQPAPGSNAGSNPYASEAGDSAFFAAAVARGRPLSNGDGAAPPGRQSPGVPAAVTPQSAAAEPAAVAMGNSSQWQAQTPAHLRGCLGDLVAFLVTDEVVTTSWSWPEEEVLRLVQAQQLQQQQQQQQAQHPAPGAFSVAVRLQLPWHLSSRGVHELLLAHRLPPPSGSSDDSAEGPLQALALVPLCVLPPAAYLEVDQHLLPSMWAEAHSLVMRGADAAAGGQGSGNSSSLQDYALAFIGSSSSGSGMEVSPDLAAAEGLTWRHWCQLAGDISRVSSLSRVLTSQAPQQQHSPRQEQAAALVLCLQELQGVVGRLLGYFLGHRLVACCEAVLQQLPPHLQPGYRAAVQQHLAAGGTADQWQQHQQKLEQQSLQQQEEEEESLQAVQAGPAHAAQGAQQPGNTAADSGCPVCAVGDAADAMWRTAALPGAFRGPADCGPAPAAAGASSKLASNASASSPSLQDSAFEGATVASSVAYSRCSSAGSSSVSRGML